MQMFPTKIFIFHCCEHILKMHLSKQGLDYMIPKDISQSSPQILKFYTVCTI
jgi:hypothetical protein